MMATFRAGIFGTALALLAGMSDEPAQRSRSRMIRSTRVGDLVAAAATFTPWTVTIISRTFPRHMADTSAADTSAIR